MIIKIVCGNRYKISRRIAWRSRWPLDLAYFSCAIRRYRDDYGSVGNLRRTIAVKHLAWIGSCAITCCPDKNRNFRCAVRRLGVRRESALEQSAGARAAQKNERNAHQGGKNVPSNQLIPPSVRSIRINR